ncbi:hypothetical protein SI65_08591 [Aspergillus cristatus]|uniref:Probable E3 ubiquitin ligase complex SCF subunit sconB n=1 Tax=Aspergillus cristatus TaxID=573508 RepID=A0A1E3B5D4_ASPCR|nr:hypothetical protein SI65_08591 [Aspergillus cristatus]
MHPRSVSEQFATAQPRSSAGRDSVSGLSRPGASSSSGGSNHTHNSRNKTVTSIPPNLLPSAPASPPTPAPSPTPHQRPLNWQSSADDEDDAFLVNARMHFSSLPNAKKQKFLMGILGLCDSQQLSFVSSFVSPRLRKDPFMVFPNELCLRVLSFIDDPQTLARASQVSRHWRELLSDDITWKNLCDKHAYVYRRFSEDGQSFVDPFHSQPLQTNSKARSFNGLRERSSLSDPSRDLSRTLSGNWPVTSLSSSTPSRKRRPRPASYRSHFKQKYMVESAWNKGGKCTQHVTPDLGVVTTLHLTPKYIIFAMDNAKIHVYDTNGNNHRTLQGHVMGVWTMVPWDDILVSGGCDREVRVWNMATGESLHLLRGHTSTVRCLQMSDAKTAISGSRDSTLRIWDLATGTCRNVLVGHQASVRCLAIHGDTVVSGSYDTTARIWSISEGRCQRTLSGHFSQIYAIAFDGKRIATGSLDTSVRVWDPHTGQCHAILQGHTSLVGQLQMQGDTLVTGGSDGSIRVWSLTKMAPIHRLAAHDNSVTSLQFDSTRIVSGGSDGRVRIWSLQTSQLLRELSAPAQDVWRVAFEEDKAVIMVNRGGRTVMEIWTFSPPPEDSGKEAVIVESASSTPGICSSTINNDDGLAESTNRQRALFSAPPPDVALNSDDDQMMPDAP